MALTAYETQTARLLHDPQFQAYSQSDVDAYINIARGQIAIEGQCVRLLLQGGMITGLTLVSGGTGYAGTATVTITGNGSQAFGIATIGGGAVTAVSLAPSGAFALPVSFPAVRAGWGYITGTTTTVTVTGSGGGSNAVVTPVIDNSVTTVAGQEVYFFSTWNALANNQALFPGVSGVIGVISIACSQSGTFKPMLEPVVFSEFQARCRIYQNTQQNYPVYWSQYGFGDGGSVYLYPWPAQPLQLDVDTFCNPISLTSDVTPEAIPYPWTDAVPYYAAYLAYENSSRKEDADRMFKMYEIFMRRGRAFAEIGFSPGYYSQEY